MPFTARADEWRSFLDGEYQIVRMYLTARIAKEMLDLNMERQRKMDMVRVRQYQRAMIEGKWTEDHPDTLAFSKSPASLIDGQKRLKAMCGVPSKQIAFQVAFGCSQEAKATIDSNQVRPAGQREWMVGSRNWQSQSEAVWAVSTANRMWAGPRNTKAQWSDAERSEFIDQHIEALTFGVRLFSKHATTRIRCAPVMAVFARASYYEDLDLLRRAAYVLRTGDKEGQRELVIQKARDFLLMPRLARNSNSAGDVYRVVGRAVKAFIDDERLKILRDTPSYDPWPLKESRVFGGGER